MNGAAFSCTIILILVSQRSGVHASITPISTSKVNSNTN